MRKLHKLTRTLNYTRFELFERASKVPEGPEVCRTRDREVKSKTPPCPCIRRRIKKLKVVSLRYRASARCRLQ
jgi:hypothetical protein